MILKKISKSLIILIASTLLFLTVAPNVSVFAKNKDITTVQDGEDIVEIRISNQELFDAFEEIGYDIKDYLSEEEIEQALIEDEMSSMKANSEFYAASIARGHTGLTIVNNSTANLHLNNIITQLLIGTGVAATTAALLKIAAIKAFFTSGSIKASALSGLIGTAVSMIPRFFSNGISITFRYSFTGARVTQVLAQ